MSSTQAVSTPLVKLKKRDFDAGIDVRWCPGCGDYSILANVQRVLPDLGVPRENFVFISGIGCSSRFPYYMNTFGFHTIHGRAPAFATGLKAHRPELDVWLITGDGDGLSIGGNHLIHILRRNLNVNIILFNNKIYGLTKGQYSPTSEVGKVTTSTPMGSIDTPFRPLSVALGAEASFAARVIDTDAKMMKDVLVAAHAHKGTSLIEVYQNCNVFNDGAFATITNKADKVEKQLHLRAGEPMLFGKGNTRGIVMRDGALTPVVIGEGGVTEKDVLVHDPTNPDPSIAFWLSRFEQPEMPVPLGVFRAVERPNYDQMFASQIEEARTRSENPGLDDLLFSGDTWTVE